MLSSSAQVLNKSILLLIAFWSSIPHLFNAILDTAGKGDHHFVWRFTPTMTQNNLTSDCKFVHVTHTIVSKLWIKCQHKYRWCVSCFITRFNWVTCKSTDLITILCNNCHVKTEGLYCWGQVALCGAYTKRRPTALFQLQRGTGFGTPVHCVILVLYCT